VASFTAGLSIAYFFRFTWAGIAALNLAILIGISRIFVGAHFPRDVVGGMIVAAGLFVMFTTLVWPRIQERIPERPDLSRKSFRAVLFTEVLICICVLVLYAPLFAESPPVAAGVALIILGFVAVRYRKQKSQPDKVNAHG
jgi:hypothetical protein